MLRISSTEKNDKKAAKHRKEGRSRGVRDFHFISTRNKFATVPKAACTFTTEKVDHASNYAHCPAGNVVDFSKIHKAVVLTTIGRGKNRVSNQIQNLILL